jgi:UDPglucose 6-dehydrogenase
MNKKTVLIVGYGVVGMNIDALFMKARNVKVSIRDDMKGHAKDPRAEEYDYAIICVPTNMKEDGSADTSIVEKAIEENAARLYIIKSTVPPGTTRNLVEKLGERIVFSPEFYGGTQHANTPHEFVIFGGPDEECEEASQLWQTVFTGYQHISHVDYETAELCKYAENAWLASQVVFFNTFKRICDAFGVDYTVFRETLLLDDRISKSHSFVYSDQPFYDSHCLNKDVPAILSSATDKGYYPDFVSAIIECNDMLKALHARKEMFAKATHKKSDAQ